MKLDAKTVSSVVLLCLHAAASQAVTLDATDRGFYRINGGHTTSNTGYAAGQVYFGPGFPVEVETTRNFFIFDLASVTGTVTGATLRLFNPQGGYLSADASETYAVHDVSTSLASLVAGTGGLAAYADLGSGTILGSVVMTAASDGTYVDVVLNAAGLTYVSSALGSQVAFGGSVTTIAGGGSNAVLGASGSLPLSATQLILDVAPVPVPAAVWLFAGALGCLGFARRRSAVAG